MQTDVRALRLEFYATDHCSNVPSIHRCANHRTDNSAVSLADSGPDRRTAVLQFPFGVRELGGEQLLLTLVVPELHGHGLQAGLPALRAAKHGLGSHCWACFAHSGTCSRGGWRIHMVRKTERVAHARANEFRSHSISNKRTVKRLAFGRTEFAASHHKSIERPFCPALDRATKLGALSLAGNAFTNCDADDGTHDGPGLIEADAGAERFRPHQRARHVTPVQRADTAPSIEHTDAGAERFRSHQRAHVAPVRRIDTASSIEHTDAGAKLFRPHQRAHHDAPVQRANMAPSIRNPDRFPDTDSLEVAHLRHSKIPP